MNTPHNINKDTAEDDEQRRKIGKAITANINFVCEVWTECDNLAKAIKEDLDIMLKSDDIQDKYRIKENKWDEDFAPNTNKHTQLDAMYSLPIATKPKIKENKYLGLQISLAGDGIEARDNDEPLVHVTWSECPMNFKSDGWYMSFPYEVQEGVEISINANCLLRWLSPDGASDYGWIYSLRLTDINSQQDIQNNIVEPVKTLLCNESNAINPAEALLRNENNAAKALAGTKAVRYQAVEGEPGQFRVLPRQIPDIGRSDYPPEVCPASGPSPTQTQQRHDGPENFSVNENH